MLYFLALGLTVQKKLLFKMYYHVSVFIQNVNTIN